MTTKVLQEIKARADAATPGPWECETHHTRWGDVHEVLISGSNPSTVSDCYFIAQARTDIPALVAEVERLQSESEKWRNAYIKMKEDWKHDCDLLVQIGAEIAMLKKALELASKYIVEFGRADYSLCDKIPQSLHLKYQPKNDGNYANGPCFECVKEYFIQQAQEQEERK